MHRVLAKQCSRNHLQRSNTRILSILRLVHTHTRASGSATLMISSMTAAKSEPLGFPLLNAPGTFSHTMYLGRTAQAVRPRFLSRSLISFTIRICSINRPDRSPARPARFPATERSWHGEPPVITSTTGTSYPLIFVISPKCFIFHHLPILPRMNPRMIPQTVPAMAITAVILHRLTLRKVFPHLPYRRTARS